MKTLDYTSIFAIFSKYHFKQIIYFWIIFNPVDFDVNNLKISLKIRYPIIFNNKNDLSQIPHKIFLKLSLLLWNNIQINYNNIYLIVNCKPAIENFTKLTLLLDYLQIVLPTNVTLFNNCYNFNRIKTLKYKELWRISPKGIYFYHIRSFTLTSGTLYSYPPIQIICFIESYTN